jgi:hypothetical protein
MVTKKNEQDAKIKKKGIPESGIPFFVWKKDILLLEFLSPTGQTDSEKAGAYQKNGGRFGNRGCGNRDIVYLKSPLSRIENKAVKGEPDNVNVSIRSRIGPIAIRVGVRNLGAGNPANECVPIKKINPVIDVY